MISATPETTHYPIAKAALLAGKHVLLEKPIALTLEEADELIELSERTGLKFTIGYSQRFNAKQALVKRSLDDGTLGRPGERAHQQAHHTASRHQDRRSRSSCRRRRWRPPTTSTSPCGASSRADRSGYTPRR